MSRSVKRENYGILQYSIAKNYAKLTVICAKYTAALVYLQRVFLGDAARFSRRNFPEQLYLLPHILEIAIAAGHSKECEIF